MTPAFGVGKAISLVYCGLSRPSTLRLLYLPTFLVASTSPAVRLSPATRAERAQASAGESSTAPCARDVERVSDDET
jgi:hypothetical protein